MVAAGAGVVSRGDLGRFGRALGFNSAAAALWGASRDRRESLVRITSSLAGRSPCRWNSDGPGIRERRQIAGAEAIFERPGGRGAFYPTPLFDADGQLVGAVSLLVDNRAQTRRDLKMLD